MRQKQTKIIATISDLNCSPEFLKELYENGMDVVRLNTAHQTVDVTRDVVKNIREVSDKLAILVDTKGPEIRTRVAPNGVELKLGSQINVCYGETDAVCTADTLYVSHDKFVEEVIVGSDILIDDGEFELKVLSKEGSCVQCKIVAGGILKSKKSVNVPGGRFSLPSLTQKDKDFIAYCIEDDVDFIAHSFVRSAEDVIQIQKILDEHNSDVKIVAKIENKEGVDNLNDILPHVHAIMVARGDLAVEMPAEQIPIVQKRMVRTCVEAGKPVIVATQMLQSMIKNPRPTRAEVSDVANAVLDGTSAVMLSGETAYGDHPVKAVKMMAKIAKHVEASKKPFRRNEGLKWDNAVHKFFARKAIEACAELDIKAIFAVTKTGATARLLSTFRGKIPIYAESPSKRTVRELAMSYGVYPFYMPQQESTEMIVEKTSKEVLEQVNLKDTDLVLFVGTTPGCATGTDFLEIKRINEIVHD